MSEAESPICIEKISNKKYTRKKATNIRKPAPFELNDEDKEIIQLGSSLFNIDKSEINTTNCQKFKCNGYRFKVSMNNNFESKTFGEASEELTEMFVGLHSDILRMMKNNDKVRVVLFHDGLDYPVGYHFMEKQEFASVNLEDTFFQVIQSYTTVLIESGSGFEADVTIARLPTGGINRATVYYQSEQDMINSAYHMVKIINNDMYCSIRSVLVAIAYYEKNKENFVNSYSKIATGKIPTTLFDATTLSKIIKQEKKPLKNEINRFLIDYPQFKRNSLIGLDIFPKLEKYFNYEYQITVIGFGERLNNNQIDNCNRHTNIYIGERKHANQKSLYILHTENHYDCIKTIKSFYRCQSTGKDFCDECKKPYYYGSHNCNIICKICHRQVCLEGEEKVCEFCFVKCKNIDCYRIHTKKVCSKAKICEECKTVRNYRHVCIGQKFCSNCKSVVEEEHKCFILTREQKKAITKKKEVEGRGYIFYDYECYEDEYSKGIHVPNLVKAIKICRSCSFKKLCKDEDLKKTFVCMDLCHSGYETFWNNVDFCDWLFSKAHMGYTAIAHNFKGYDGILVLDYIKSNRTGHEGVPQLLMNGTKIMTMVFRGVRFIDSLNFIQLPLEKFPETFGLTEMKKGYFPHKFNQPKNWDYVGKLPDIQYYQHEYFSVSKKTKFEEWYNDNKDKTFNFKKEIEGYCESDVKLLMEGCLQFLDFIYGVSEIEPMVECITLASLTHEIFRKMNMIPNTIGIIPEKGYNAKQMSSKISMLWLKYLSSKHKIFIQHRLNGGEKKIGRYFVDGFCEETKTIYEFLGCFWHGCPKCYDESSFNNRLQKQYGTIFHQTLQRINEIKQQMPGYKVVYTWECDFKRSKNPDLIKFKMDNEYVEALNPRDCMYGGRTNALKLYHMCEENEIMRYYDFKSLYPYVQKYGIFPVGHPEIITENFKDIKEYFGLVKCTVLPPQNLLHPILPDRMRKKLLFHLCTTCAIEQQYTCNHTEKERVLTGTWVSLELNEAIKNGYIIKKIHEVWHYKESMQYDKEKKEGGQLFLIF